MSTDPTSHTSTGIGGRTSYRAGGVRIAVFSLVQDHGAMGGGGSGARLITASDGNRWVMKSPVLGGQKHRFFCLNEALCGLVGKRIGVNVPDVAAIELTTEQLRAFSATAFETDRFAVATRLIEPAEALTPTTAIAVPKASRAAIVTFDALVTNSDRKEEHLLAHNTDSEEWDVASIDHGHTIAMGDALTAVNAQAPIAQPLPLLVHGLTSDDVSPWIESAQGVTRVEFKQMVAAAPAAWVVEPDGDEVLAEVLTARARNLAQSLSPYLPAPATL
jgi:HipA-like kinase